MVPFIIQGDNIVVYADGTPSTVDKTHINYNKLLDALKSEDWDAIPGLLTVKSAIKTMSAGDVTFDGETLMYKNRVMEGALSSRLVKMFNEGFPIAHLLNFVDRLNKNPSYRAIQELYGFLEANSLPITTDGYFLAYKRVRDDYKDVYSGTMDNSVGAVVEMPRSEVDDDRDRTCSAGLHFCGYSYLQHFSGSRIVVLKIDPADVVSIPSDYNNQKGRACRYTVVEEIENTEDAVKNDCLGKGPAVVKIQETKEKSQPVEVVFYDLSESQVGDLVSTLLNNTGKYLSLMYSEYDLDDLLRVYTFREIRAAMKKLNFI